MPTGRDIGPLGRVGVFSPGILRIPHLAAMLGAEDRLVDEGTSDTSLRELLSTPLRASVASRIAERRERSDAFLDAALA